MINSIKELNFYIAADRIMNGLSAQRSLRERLNLFPHPFLKIIKTLRYMRMTSYYKGLTKPTIMDRIYGAWSSYMYKRLSMNCGFSIGCNVFGYGLVIPHYGTIVVNGGIRAGNFCVLHTSTCIGGSDKIIGNGLYLASGAKIMGKLTLGNGVSVAANSLVNNSVGNNVLLAGCPAFVKRQNYPYWWERDGEKYIQRVARVEKIKKQMELNI